MSCIGSKCAVLGCLNYRSQKRRSFYSFPKDKDLCMQWIVLTQKPGLDELLKSQGPDRIHMRHVVCSDHFQEKDFRNKNMLSQGIWPGSVPSLLLPKPKQIEPHGKQQGKVTTVLGLTNDVPNDTTANQVEAGFTAGHESSELYFGENKPFSSDTRDQVPDRITVKVEPEPRHEGNPCEEHGEVPDRITVKVEPEPRHEGNPCEEHGEVPDRITVKVEPEPRHEGSPCEEHSEVPDRITVKVEPEPRHEGNPCEEHSEVPDRITVKVEPEPRHEGSPCEEHSEEPEYIIVKGEPPDVEEDEGPPDHAW